MLKDEKKMKERETREVVKRKIEKMESRAQVKEQLGQVKKDYDEEAEANRLYVESIKAKLELLKSYES